jgi:hypothetical protein
MYPIFVAIFNVNNFCYFVIFLYILVKIYYKRNYKYFYNYIINIEIILYKFKLIKIKI